jgi:hypothetical protein
MNFVKNLYFIIIKLLEILKFLKFMIKDKIYST